MCPLTRPVRPRWADVDICGITPAEGKSLLCAAHVHGARGMIFEKYCVRSYLENEKNPLKTCFQCDP